MGDKYGIELKVHTMPKVTLFTPEPDFGLYAENFNEFMEKYGYQDANGDFRITGIHKAGIRCKKSGLTMRVGDYVENEDKGGQYFRDYDPNESFTMQMDKLSVVLLDDEGLVAAGWSLERILNNWDNKHNEVVYISAKKEAQDNSVKLGEGFKHKVYFHREVTWCRNTSGEHLMKAIYAGIVFLDPAPKYAPEEPARNKRRSQWRVNNIDQAAKVLYNDINYKTID